MSSSVYAITLNWNRCQDTLDCLKSLSMQTLSGLRVVVVDNASTDGSPEIISQQFPAVEQVINPENLGFGRGFNIGIRYALDQGADYIFLINNDAWIAPDGVEKLLEHAAPDIGLLAPLIYYASQPEIIWSVGGKANRWTLEIKHACKNQPDPGNWPVILEQDFITGCAFLMPRRTCEMVGSFDEQFHAYYEDMDLSYRVQNAGLRICVIPAAHVWHKVSMSSGGTNSANERYWMARSSLRFFRKHAHFWQWSIIAPYRFGSALKTTVNLLRQGRGASARAYWQGLRDGLWEDIRGKPHK